jgi:hypothetical protein
MPLEYSEEEWEKLRPFITKLYAAHDFTRSDVCARLKTMGFDVK